MSAAQTNQRVRLHSVCTFVIVRLRFGGTHENDNEIK